MDITADQTSHLFPRQLQATVRGYLFNTPSYTPQSQQIDEARRQIEELLFYAKNRVADEECKVNTAAFPKEYGDVPDRIARRIATVERHAEYDTLYDSANGVRYFGTIKRLKYLRRWNRINRVVNTSVLAHTYVVAVLTMYLCWLEESLVSTRTLPNDFQYRAMLRALFHDLPESLTGDLITPVKRALAARNPETWPAVEERAIREFEDTAPEQVRQDLANYGLLRDFDTSAAFSIDSLVKDCDRLALILECVYERDSGRSNPEMVRAYESYVRELQKSEWPSTREVLTMIVAHEPR